MEEPIRKNKISLLDKKTGSHQLKSSKEVKHLQNDCSLFSRLYVSCQIRSGNLEEFFKHENQAYPPSLSQSGLINYGVKSDLITCLEEIEGSTCSERPQVDMVILDGAAIVHLLKPGAAKTFQDYSTEVFLPYVKVQLQDATRLDIVWDQYDTASLKLQTRRKCGTGPRRQVKPS